MLSTISSNVLGSGGRVSAGVRRWHRRTTSDAARDTLGRVPETLRRSLIGALAAVAVALTGCSAAGGGHPSRSRGSTSTAASTATRATPTPPRPLVSRTVATPTPTSAPVAKATTRRALAPASASALPLHLSTGDAEQVITVTASSPASTTARVRAWARGPGGWRAVGPVVPAFIGADGIGRASEQTSRTPSGSYTLTRAFGHDANPGTSLPYVHTTPADWWISEPGPLYNTRQRCASACPFTTGAPNEPLYATMPFYRYAVVIDYNTRNAPSGVRPGAGSAFFLHVEVGKPTQGCVAIPQDQLVRLLRWLSPERHPRILLGVG
jgi:L,D-peptidoglycan transpeptidase YkuD (ErfK/YbiS/YcfS/YnhG family)